MKLLLYGAVIAALGIGMAWGQGKGFDSSLPSPDKSGLTGKMGENAKKFSELLKEGELDKFYTEAGDFLLTLHYDNTHRVPDRKELDDYAWTLYLICGTPTFRIEKLYLFPMSWTGDQTIDLDTKQELMSFVHLSSHDIDKVAKKTGYPEEALRKLFCLYYAKSWGTLRSAYDPEWDRSNEKNKIKEKNNEIWQKFGEDFKAWRYASGNAATLELRNTLLKRRLDRSEPSFVETLIAYYPTRSAEVFRYIRMAGYKEDEIPGLIDRTVGRDAKTEYLYKGRKIEKSDKKEKKK